MKELPKETPDVIPLDANEEDVKAWLASDLVAKLGLSPEEAIEAAERIYSDKYLDSQLIQ